MDPQNLVTFVSPFLSLFSCLIYKAKPAGAPTQRFPFAYSLTQTHNISTKTHQRLVKEKKFKETNRGFPFWAMATVAECSKELHVLAVDDSYVDRKLIERLLQISSCKGNYWSFSWKDAIVFILMGLWSELKCVFFFFAVTAVESGTRALQYLGLDGEQSNVGFDVSADFF